MDGRMQGLVTAAGAPSMEEVGLWAPDLKPCSHWVSDLFGLTGFIPRTQPAFTVVCVDGGYPEAVRVIWMHFSLILARTEQLNMLGFFWK